jgi:RES domain
VNLENIINEFDDKVQAYKDKDDNYGVFVKILLDEYVSKIDSTDLLEDIDNKYIPSLFAAQRNLKRDTQLLAEGVIKTINHYLSESNIDGVAYNTFTNTINQIGALNLTQSSIPINSAFYRLRPLTTSSTILQRKDLFHIPFESRGIASTNRYSLSGYPCLYLANSTFVAWKELSDAKDTDLELYAGTKIINTRPLKFIEIDSKPFKDRIFDNDFDRYSDLFQYALLFPLIATCSIKVRDNHRNNKFKSEYIIPQLLLEYVRKNSANIDGIKYRSTRVEDEKASAWNYAIPPKQVQESGYCPSLKSLFLVSEIENFNFKDPHRIDNCLPSKNHIDIYQITLNSKPYLFEKTLFAQAEYLLNTKKLDIDF